MLNTNLTSKTCKSATQTRKSRKTTFKKMFLIRSRGFSWIPGSEPKHLDLEKLSLLSDSVGNFKFNRKIEISEPEKKLENKSENVLLGPFFGTIRNELSVGLNAYVCYSKPPAHVWSMQGRTDESLSGRPT